MEQKFFLSDTLTHWGHNCANPIVPSHAKSNSFYKYVPLRIKIKVVFFPLSADDSSSQNPFFFFFSTFKSVPNSSSVEELEAEKGAEEKKRRKLLFLSVPDNPPSSVSLSSDLSDAVSWNSDSWRGVCGKGTQRDTVSHCKVTTE